MKKMVAVYEKEVVLSGNGQRKVWRNEWQGNFVSFIFGNLNK